MERFGKYLFLAFLIIMASCGYIVSEPLFQQADHIKLETSRFTGTLSPIDKNVQQFAETVDKFVLGGGTLWDAIGDPSGNGEIDFANTTQEIKVGATGELQIGDGAGTNVAEFATNGTMTLKGTAELADSIVSMTPSEFAKFHQIYIAGHVYKSTTQTTFLEGSNGMCSGEYWVLTADVDVTSTMSVNTTQDIHYFYIDDSASTGNYPTPTIISSTEEPVYVEDIANGRIGWYGSATVADRCIGAWYETTADVLKLMYWADEGWYASSDYFVSLALNTNPNAAWNDTTNDADAYTPVNTKGLQIWLNGEDAGAACLIYCRHKDSSTVASVPLFLMKGYNEAVNLNWCEIPMKADNTVDRTLQILGADDDDNKASCSLYGYRIHY